MKPFSVPECFWGFQKTYCECNCEKVFFDVLIDFEKYRIMICKDWYAHKIKSLINGVKCDIENPYTYRNPSIHECQEIIIEYIITEYFEQPVMESVKHIEPENRFANGNHKIFFRHSIRICKRPSMYVFVDIIKFIHFYKTNIEKRYFGDMLNVYQSCCNQLRREIEYSFTPAKYAKLRPLLNKLTTDSISDTDLIILFSELLKELSKLKINDYVTI
jgi:hypothetical protein